MSRRYSSTWSLASCCVMQSRVALPARCSRMGDAIAGPKAAATPKTVENLIFGGGFNLCLASPCGRALVLLQTKKTTTKTDGVTWVCLSSHGFRGTAQQLMLPYIDGLVAGWLAG